MNVNDVVRYVRSWLSTWFVPVAIVLLIMTVFGGWAVVSGYSFSGISSESEFEHSATVQQENPLFPVGTELTGRTVYFTPITPELTGTFVYTHSDDATYTAETDIILVTESIGEEDEEYWRVTQGIATEQNQIGPDDQHRVPFNIDVQREVQRIAAIEETLGEDDGEPRLVLIAETTVRDRNGSVVETETDRLLITLDENTYHIEQGEDEGALRELLRWLGTILFFLLSATALIGLVVAQWRDELDPKTDNPIATDKRERKRFDAWISQGVISEQHTSKPQVEASSLKDLVDIAIDTDGRVIQDDSRGGYYVIDGDTLYTYEPPDRVVTVDATDTTADGSENSESNE